MDVLGLCFVGLVEVTHSVEGFGGSMCIAERVHRANTLVPAGGVGHGSG